MTRTTRIGWSCVAATMAVPILCVAWIGRGCAQFFNQEEFSLAGCDGDVDRLRTALARGAEINRVDSEHGYLAIVCAAGNGEDEAARFLLSRGASPYKSDEAGGSAYA
ncbi:ankyrin repeat domain-containing protein, partial [bacterium]